VTPDARWDDWNAGSAPRYPHEKVVQFCMRAFAAERRRGATALDLGCGTGRHLVFLAREGFAPVGVDGSPVAVEVARGALAREGLTGRVAVARIDEADLGTGRLDLSVCVSVLDTVSPETAREAVRRVARALRPGGRGLFLFAGEGDFRVAPGNPLGLRGWGRAEVDEAFAAGFSRVDVDRYLTTYEGGRHEQRDWLVTVTR